MSASPPIAAPPTPYDAARADWLIRWLLLAVALPPAATLGAYLLMHWPDSLDGVCARWWRNIGGTEGFWGACTFRVANLNGAWGPLVPLLCAAAAFAHRRLLRPAVAATLLYHLVVGSALLAVVSMPPVRDADTALYVLGVWSTTATPALVPTLLLIWAWPARRRLLYSWGALLTRLCLIGISLLSLPGIVFSYRTHSGRFGNLPQSAPAALSTIRTVALLHIIITFLAALGLVVAGALLKRRGRLRPGWLRVALLLLLTMWLAARLPQISDALLGTELVYLREASIAKEPLATRLNVQRMLSDSHWITLAAVLYFFWRPVLRGAVNPQLDAPTPDCPNCGYNLTGNVSGRCPECGAPAVIK